jgi:hypothetical protein
MHKYLIVAATNKTLTIGNFPKLIEFLRSKKTGCSHVTRLNGMVVLFCHELDVVSIKETFPSLLDSKDEVALFEILGGEHQLNGAVKNHVEAFLDA